MKNIANVMLANKLWVKDRPSVNRRGRVTDLMFFWQQEKLAFKPQKAVFIGAVEASQSYLCGIKTINIVLNVIRRSNSLSYLCGIMT